MDGSHTKIQQLAQQPTLTRHVEEAAVNAWPAMQQMLLDGWLLRFSKGLSMRSNCVVPLYDPVISRPETLLDRVRYCENLYAREQLRCVFRISATDQRTDMQQLDKLLIDRGYGCDQPSHILSRALTTYTPNAHPRTEVRLHPLQGWLDGYCELMGMPEPARDLHRIILQSIGQDCAFALAHHNHAVIGCGLAIADHLVGGVFDIYTHPDFRGLGVGRDMVDYLLQWLQGRELQAAYLQVLQNNHTAAALYASMGFNPLYTFWYRQDMS